MKAVYVTVCPTVYPLSTHLYLQRIIAVSHWFVSQPLASATLFILDPQGLIQMSRCCSVSWRSDKFGSAGLAYNRTVSEAPATKIMTQKHFIKKALGLSLGLLAISSYT